jgi:hypothetical protein
VHGSVCVSVSISETREVTRKAPSEVGGVHSSDETPVMGADAKEPRFDDALNAAGGFPSSPEGAAHG